MTRGIKDFKNMDRQAALNRNGQIYELWRDIGPASQWPFLIRRLFWTKNLRHFQRILVCTFCFVNGLNPIVFEEWAVLFGLCSNSSSIQHIKNLFRLFENGRNYTLYAWNVSARRYEYLDGRVRRYTHRSRRN